MHDTGVVLLAAGLSERYGGDKRLAAITLNGHTGPMLLTTIKQIQASGLPLWVVLRPGDEQWEKQLSQMGIDWGTCPEAALGMGHSLAFGVHATQQWQHWIIALADMPFVQPATYRAIARALEHYPIVRPHYTDPATGVCHAGNPVGFQQQFGYQLMQCSGDNGARALLRQHADQVFALAVNDAGIVQDIDQPYPTNSQK